MPRKLLSELKEFQDIQLEVRVISGILLLVLSILATYLIYRAFVPSPPTSLDMGVTGAVAVICLILCALQLHFLRSALARFESKVSGLAFTDGLTGVYNYHYLHTRLGQETERARRYSHPLSILYIDLDGLKRVNDLYGHRVGNEVLMQVGALLRSGARENDLVGRVGGDEFLVILPETDAKAAQTAAERVRGTFDDYKFRSSASPEIEFLTTSVGIACFSPEYRKPSEFLDAADQAMYRAKQAGGNQVAF